MTDHIFKSHYSEVENARDAYLYFKDLIKTKGNLITARGEATKEVLNASVLIKNSRDFIIPVRSFNYPFGLQETFDILNENAPQTIQSDEIVKTTMGELANPFFFGNENRQGNSRWSLLNIRNVLRDDKFSRKAIISYGSRRPSVHYPCMTFASFIIRDDQLHLTYETRASGLTIAWVYDMVLFGIIHQTMLGWLREFYPELELGGLLYKTTSMHYYCDVGEPRWTQEFDSYRYQEKPHTFDLSHKEWVQEMGVLYHYVDEYSKAVDVEDIDNGKITTKKDLLVMKPNREYFKTEFFYRWALVLFYKNSESIRPLTVWEKCKILDL